MDTSTGLRVETVCSEQLFAGLRAEWNRLAQQVNDDSVFLRHEWFDAAWQWKRFEGELYVLCVYRGDTLTGILPLVRTRTRINRLPIRKIGYLDIPDTQVCDLVCAPEDAKSVSDAVVHFLRKGGARWDLLEIPKLAPHTLAHRVLQQAVAQNGLAFEYSETGNSPGIGLEDTWEDFYARRSRRLKKGNNHVANKLKREGKDIRIEWLNSDLDSADRLQGVLGLVTELSSKSWKNDTGLTLDNPGPEAFITRLSEHAARNQWLSVFVLYVGDEAVAAEYQLLFNGVISALRADYNDQYEALSPGTYLNWKLLERLFCEDLVYYSMGPGSNEYKLRWAEVHEPNYTLTVYNSSPKGKVASLLNLHVKPLIKRFARKTSKS